MTLINMAMRRRRVKSAVPPPPDVTAPTIVSTSPADNATGVSLTVSPTITFSENITFGTGLITLRQNIASVWSDVETFDVTTDVGADDGKVGIAANVLSINPTVPLTSGREYAVRIEATAIEDTSGNAFAGIANDTTFSFTGEVVDVIAPTIVGTSPADNATGVAETISPTITFSEDIAFGTGLITLRENNGGWADLETFDVVTEVGTGNGQVSISGAILTINPTAVLSPSREYAIRIAATAIDDLAGNSFAGVANDTTISFTTITPAASVPSAATAPWGAKTIAGAGGYRPQDTDGNPVDIVSYDSLVSGSLGSYVPSIVGGALRFTGGGAGGPSNVVLRVTHAAGGTQDITIGTPVANTYNTSSVAETDAAVKAAVLGDTIWITNGSYNPTAVRTVIGRSTSPAGTWTGTTRDLLPTANWVTVTRAPSAKVVFGCIEMGMNGGPNPAYLRLHDIDIVSPYNGNSSGNGTGVSINVSGQIAFSSSGGYYAVTDCRITMVTPITPSSIGGFKSIHCYTSDCWIEGNVINGTKFGLQGDCRRSVVRGNTVLRCQADAYYFRICSDMLFEGNVSDDKIYGYQEQAILGITRGASTVLTLADTSQVSINEPCALIGISGALGDIINNKFQNVTSKTASTITLQLNTTGAPAWDGVAGTVQTAFGFHGDGFQVADDAGGAGLQDRVTIRGNIFKRGNPGGVWPGGQLIVGNASGTPRARNDWLIEGNIYQDAFQNAPVLGSLVNGLIRSNTFVRTIGIDASNGGSTPGIIFAGGLATGNVLLDNIANQFSYTTEVATAINNYVLPLTANDAVPADPATIAAYEAAFVEPPLVPNTDYDAITALATRTDAGGAFNGYAIFPGATPYYNFATHVYTDPRSGAAPDAMSAPTSSARSRSTALTITKAADPFDGGSPITSYDLRHSPDGSSWTTVTGFTSPYELTGLTPGQNYHIQTRAVNAIGAGGWSPSVQEKTSLVDFTVSPTSSGMTVSSITDGWSLAMNASGSKVVSWNIDGLLAVSASATLTFTFETDSVADVPAARAAQNSILSAIRGMNYSITGLVVNTPANFTATISSATSDTDWIGFWVSSTAAKTFRVTNIKLVTP